MSELRTTMKHVLFLLMSAAIYVALRLCVYYFDRTSPICFRLFQSILLCSYYYTHLSGKGPIRRLILGFSAGVLFWMLIQAVKYFAFGGTTVGRYLWYAYYIPELICPLLIFYAGLCIGRESVFPLHKKWWWTAAVTMLLLVVVMTNDLHQLIWTFQPGFVDFEHSYSHGLLFYVVLVWHAVLLISGLCIMLKKCRSSAVGKIIWLPVALAVLLYGYTLLILLGIEPTLNGFRLAQYPETVCFAMVLLLECCIGLGLIPVNVAYADLMRQVSLDVTITDADFHPIYSSTSTDERTRELLLNPPPDENHMLHRMDVRGGGYGFWRADVTELNRLNQELAALQEKLNAENEVYELNNRLREKQARLEAQSAIYDRIALRVQPQLQQTEALLLDAELHPEHYDRNIARTCILGAWVKRTANLMLSAREKRNDLAELGPAIAEVLRYLNLAGIPGDCLCNASGTVAADTALTLFDSSLTLVWNVLDALRGVYVRLEGDESCLLKLTLEGAAMPELTELQEDLLQQGIRLTAEYEDGVSYLRLAFGREGAAAC